VSGRPAEMGATSRLCVQSLAPPLARLWARLRAARMLRFEARGAAACGWNGAGAGRVAVAEPLPGVLIYEESGRWRPAGGQEIAFRNALRWSSANGRLRLEHLRAGPERPLFLIELGPAADGVWRARRPHHCGADRYDAALALEDDCVLLAWTVDGPRKRAWLEHRYR